MRPALFGPQRLKRLNMRGAARWEKTSEQSGGGGHRAGCD